MSRSSIASKRHFIISLLLLMGMSQNMNGQRKESRTLFPVNDNTAFIDLRGNVVIRASQPELLAAISNALPTPRQLHGAAADASIRFGEFSEGLAVVGWALCPLCRNPQYISGFIDDTGRLVIPPKTSVTRYGQFHEGLAQYSDHGSGFIDREGHVVIEGKFYEVSDFSEGLAFVRLTQEGKFGYLDQTGRLVIPFQYQWASDFHDGLAAVKDAQGALAFIDKSGKVVLQEKDWLEIGDFSEGLASVKVEVVDNSVYQGYKSQKFGYIDRAGKPVIPPRFDRVQKFSEGRALFLQTGKSHGYGFIDTNGQVVIQPEYVDGRSFSEGLAAVAIKSPADRNIWGYINPEGAWVIKPQFQHVNSFAGGLAAVDCDEYGGHCHAYIDRAGKVRWQELSVHGR